MKLFAAQIKAFLYSEDGTVAVEYAVMTSLICLVCYTSIGDVGTSTHSLFQTAASQLP